MQLSEQRTGVDLAQLLSEDQGTFIALKGDQSYLVTAAPGHSIKSLRPLSQQSSNFDQWAVTKISNQDITQEQGDPQSQYRTQNQSSR